MVLEFGAKCPNFGGGRREALQLGRELVHGVNPARAVIIAESMSSVAIQYVLLANATIAGVEAQCRTGILRRVHEKVGHANGDGVIQADWLFKATKIIRSKGGVFAQKCWRACIEIKALDSSGSAIFVRQMVLMMPWECAACRKGDPDLIGLFWEGAVTISGLIA